MDDIMSVVGDLIKAIGDWKTVGAIASLGAIVMVLVRLSKTSLGGKLLGYHTLAKPIFAAVSGGLLAMLASLGSGQPWSGVLLSALGGVISGLVASGAHEAASFANPSVAASRAAGEAMRRQIDNLDAAQVAPKVKELKEALDSVRSIKDQKARMRALAEYLSK